MMCPGVFQRLKERSELKSIISEYLCTIGNFKEYEDAKNILNAYYFDDKKFAEIRELNKDAGTYDLIQYRIDNFKEFFENRGKDNEEPEREV